MWFPYPLGWNFFLKIADVLTDVGNFSVGQTNNFLPQKKKLDRGPPYSSFHPQFLSNKHPLEGLFGSEQDWLKSDELSLPLLSQWKGASGVNFPAISQHARKQQVWTHQIFTSRTAMIVIFFLTTNHTFVWILRVPRVSEWAVGFQPSNPPNKQALDKVVAVRTPPLNLIHAVLVLRVRLVLSKTGVRCIAWTADEGSAKAAPLDSASVSPALLHDIGFAGSCGAHIGGSNTGGCRVYVVPGEHRNGTF